ncbi:LamG-like jellyroll fold domain-containing protein [Sphingobacterium suaedae]|uniref:LamG-like jellyroll fold domain-containing protein n=1 Tax=Sphingobacterium suaedae TaxID=1686402 RepID=A0ABW5KLR4_9SPHI
MNILNKVIGCLLFGVVLTATSCTKYADPAPTFEEYEQPEDTTLVDRKVLIISIDGLVGAELKKEVPPTIASLLENSKFSFESIADENTSDPASWASMMTGVSSNRHHITSESYIPDPDPNDPHGTEEFFPSVFYRVTEQNPRLNTIAITQNVGLANVLLMDASESIIAESDETAKGSAVARLKSTDPDLMLLQFTSVLEAGKSGGFSIENPTYKAAISDVDGYISEVLGALKERPTYAKEEWLLIVTSNHGGLENGYGGASFQERNTFTLYHYPSFSKQELIADIFVAPRFYGYDVNNASAENVMRGRNTSVPSEETNYNIARTGELTVEAKIKVNKNASGNYSYSWPPFLSKVAARSGTTAGWSFFRSGNNVNFFVADGNVKIEIGGGPLGVDEIWSHFTGVFARVNGVPTAKFYVNGTLVATGTEPTLNIGAVSSTSPLTFGFQQEVFSSAYLDFYMADVHIWNVALSDQEVLENSRRIGVAEDHPRRANLVGYWTLDDGGAVFKNKVIGMPDIPVWGKANYNVFGNNLPYVDPEKSILLKSQDIMPQALYWLNITIRDNWGLEGQSFLKNFELEFLK